MEYIVVVIGDEVKVIFEDKFILQDVRATVHRIEQVLELLEIKDYKIKIRKYEN